jgi:hypothetical protein
VKIELIRGRGGDFPDMRITQYPGEGLKCSYVKSRKDMINHSEIQRIGPFRIYERRQPVSKGLSKKLICALTIMKESSCRIERFNCKKKK